MTEKSNANKGFIRNNIKEISPFYHKYVKIWEAQQ